MQTGFTNFNIRKTYKTEQGNEVKIFDIYVNAAGLKPSCIVKYRYSLKNGKSGFSQSSMEQFVDMVRND